MSMEIAIVPALTDNYVYVLHDLETGKVGCVDPSTSEDVEDYLDDEGLRLDVIFNTHHHRDHIGGNDALKKTYSAHLYAAALDRHRIDGIDRELVDGEEFKFGRQTVRVLHIPGHTLGHIALYFVEEAALFCGDTMFALGCGRLFEGTPEQMHASLERLAALPDATRVYCGHEYTVANGRFAAHLEPSNMELHEHLEHIRRLRGSQQPSLPTTIEIEKRFNPFLRTSDLAIAKAVGREGVRPSEVFAALRAMKDTFK